MSVARMDECCELVHAELTSWTHVAYTHSLVSEFWRPTLRNLQPRMPRVVREVRCQPGRFDFRPASTNSAIFQTWIICRFARASTRSFGSNLMKSRTKTPGCIPAQWNAESRRRRQAAWEASVNPTANGESVSCSGQSGAKCALLAPIEHDSEHKASGSVFSSLVRRPPSCSEIATIGLFLIVAESCAVV